MGCFFDGLLDNFVTNFGKSAAEIRTSELSKLELNSVGFPVENSGMQGWFDASEVSVDVGKDWRSVSPDLTDCAAETQGSPPGTGQAGVGTECGRMSQMRDDSAVDAWNAHCSLVSETQNTQLCHHKYFTLALKC